MDDTAAWNLEERFWLEGTSFFAELLDPCCLMAFPGMGVMRASDVMKSLENVPRWDSVVMDDRHLKRAGDNIVVLGYTATGRRGGDRYRCYCTSTYRAAGDDWKLLQHQQTVID